MLIHMHEPHSSGVRIITHFDHVEVVMGRGEQSSNGKLTA